jgi:hypothetical protein
MGDAVLLVPQNGGHSAADALAHERVYVMGL